MPGLLDGEPDFPVVPLPPSAAVSAKAAVEFLVGHLASLGRFPPGETGPIVARIFHRESLGSTGIGRGVAIPHARSEAVNGVAGLLARSAEGVRWPDALDGQPVHVICLFVTPASDPAAALRTANTVAARLRRLPWDDGEGEEFGSERDVP